MPASHRVLLVDDDPSVLTYLARLIREEEIGEPTSESDPRRALERIRAEPFDLVVLDLRMPEVDGFEVLEELARAQPKARCVVLTGEAEVELAVRALKLGAHDFVVKGAGDVRLIQAIHAALPPAPQAQPGDVQRFGEFMSRAPEVAPIFAQLQRVAKTDLPVILEGPSGTGKELLARELHRTSARDGSFVALNVAAIPPELFAQQLFGRAEGVLSAASVPLEGCLRAAQGGTLFLDCLDALSLDLQSQLLRVCEEREFCVLGESRARHFDGRLLAATSVDLREQVKADRFLPGLYHRLRGALIRIPPLRERPADMTLLVEHLVAEQCEAFGKPVPQVAPKTIAVLKTLPWPGNVRELRNVIRDAILSLESGALIPSSLPPEYRGQQANTEQRSLAAVEREHIERVLAAGGGNISQAARTLGISRVTLHRKLKAYRQTD